MGTGSGCVFSSAVTRGICDYGLLFSHFQLHRFLDETLVRHTKELCRLLPPLKGPTVYSIRMTHRERTTYNDLVELTRRNLFCTYFTRTNKVGFLDMVILGTHSMPAYHLHPAFHLQTVSFTPAGLSFPLQQPNQCNDGSLESAFQLHFVVRRTPINSAQVDHRNAADARRSTSKVPQ